MKNIVEQIYKLTEETMINQEYYFHGHGVPVAEYARRNALMMRADPFICQIAGLLHDIGYTADYNPRRNDHIIKGAEIAETLLKKVDISSGIRERIIDCILTHDNNLKPGSRIENKIVHDSDLLVFYDSIPLNMELVIGFGASPKQAIQRLKDEADKKLPWIHLPYFKKVAKSKHAQFLVNIDALERLTKAGKLSGYKF